MNTDVTDLLDRLAEIGAKVRPAGDRLIVRAGANPVPAELVRELRRTKAEVLAALEPQQRQAGNPEVENDPSWWWQEYRVRTLKWQLCGRRAYDEAQQLAYGELINEWHHRHAQADVRCCAGCGDTLPADVGLVVDQGGVRVHFDPVRGFDCLIAYGRRWRGKAVAALAGL